MTPPLAQRLNNWLGTTGRKFFMDLYREHGEDFGLAVLHLPLGIPHMVHLREGMTVRNWLRDQPECQGWDQAKLEKEWARLVVDAIAPKRSIFDLLKGKG